MKLIPFLGFKGQTHEAMAFYAQALGGKVTAEMQYRDMPPSDGSPGCNEMPPETLDHVAHSQLEVGAVGFAPAFVHAMLAHRIDDVVAIQFCPEQAFDQSPGPHAGASLMPQASAPGAT